jgi:uncharacterized protein (TIGR03437 family)
MGQIDLVGATEISFRENSEAGKSFRLSPVPDNIHVLTNCGDSRMDDYGALPFQSMVTHAGGSLVSTWGQVAKPGEELVIYAYGLGATDPSVKSGEASGGGDCGALANPPGLLSERRGAVAGRGQAVRRNAVDYQRQCRNQAHKAKSSSCP